MPRFFRRHRSSVNRLLHLPRKFQRRVFVLLLLMICTWAGIGLTASRVQAQRQPTTPESNIQRLEDQEIRRFAPPVPATPPSVQVPEEVIPPAIEPPRPATRRQFPPVVENSPAPINIAPVPGVQTQETPRPAVRRPIPPILSSPSPALLPAPSPGNATPTPNLRQQPGVQTAQPNDADAIVTDNSPPGQYILEFNRSPVVGNRFHLQGIYNEARLGFTRPRSWKINSVKAAIRFQHSPALLANRSNLTIRLNGTSIGSVPLNLQQSQVGQVLFDIPPSRLGDFNDIAIVVQQHNTENCDDEDPSDPTLWTEILPDSRLVFNYQRAPYRLDFSTYPFPFFDDLSLDPNQIAFIQPQQLNESWLTATARYTASLGRLADYRPLETRLVKTIDQAKFNERLVLIGTPEEQPILKSLNLPLRLVNNQFLDGSQNPLAPDVGAIILTTIQRENSRIPLLVVTGNGIEGVTKAVQFLVQPQDRKISTGRAIFVNQITPIPSPSARQWPRFLPETNTFKLSDLKAANNQPFEDITVRGSNAPPIEFDFRALPDDSFKRGSSMNLVYSYGPQVNPRTSVVEVLLDGNFIGGARLTSESGENRKTVKINLPENLIKPDSKIRIGFRLNSREPGVCGRVNDQHLTGTLHADTSFNLQREISVVLPDLKLLQFGYPLTAPQDLSSTAIMLPDAPSNEDLATLLELSERLGRLSQSDSVQLKVFKFGSGNLTVQDRARLNLVGIGVRERFPFPEVFQSGEFKLEDLYSRQGGQASIQTVPDGEGVIKQIISPWSSDRILLALTAQTPQGLGLVQKVLDADTWFYQLQGDTVIIGKNAANPTAYDPNAYRLQYFQRSTQRRVEDTDLLSRVSRILQDNWFMLPTAIVVFALILYGISQLYLKRIAAQGK